MKRRESGGDSGDSEEAENILYLIRIFFFRTVKKDFLLRQSSAFLRKMTELNFRCADVPFSALK